MTVMPEDGVEPSSRVYSSTQILSYCVEGGSRTVPVQYPNWFFCSHIRSRKSSLGLRLPHESVPRFLSPHMLRLCRGWESNPQPGAYETPAPPLSYLDKICSGVSLVLPLNYTGDNLYALFRFVKKQKTVLPRFPSPANIIHSLHRNNPRMADCFGGKLVAGAGIAPAISRL